MTTRDSTFSEYSRQATTQALAHALSMVGDRWTLLIVHSLEPGPAKYGDLAKHLGAAPNVLAQRLRQLQADGLLDAEPYQQRPLRMSYSLTQEGKELTGVLHHLAHWGAAIRGDDANEVAQKHRRCGSTVTMRAWCETCHEFADGGEQESDPELNPTNAAVESTTVPTVEGSASEQSASSHDVVWM